MITTSKMVITTSKLRLKIFIQPGNLSVNFIYIPPIFNYYTMIFVAKVKFLV